jgi:octaprenyl-diphosphate synthase
MRALLDNDNLDSEAIETLINYAKKHGGIEYAQERMLQLRNQAVECLDILPHSLARQALIELLDYTINREK